MIIWTFKVVCTGFALLTVLAVSASCADQANTFATATTQAHRERNATATAEAKTENTVRFASLVAEGLEWCDNLTNRTVRMDEFVYRNLVELSEALSTSAAMRDLDQYQRTELNETVGELKRMYENLGSPPHPGHFCGRFYAWSTSVLNRMERESR